MGRNTVSVIGREAATATKASAFSLQSLVMCSSFQAEKLPKRCLTRDTYFSIRESRDSYSSFTWPTTNRESLRIISLSAAMVAVSSIPARMASYSDSLLEALKPKWIACSIFSPVGDSSYRPMSTPVCRDAPSILRVHQLKLLWLILAWGISTIKSAITCPFLANLSLY